MGTLTQTPAWSNPFPSLPPPTSSGAPIMLNASDSHSAHGHHLSSGNDFSQRGPHTVPMPNVTRRPQYGGELVSAHDKSLCGINDYHSANYSRQILSPAIATPMAMHPTFGVRNSHYTNPEFCLGPALSQRFGHPTSAFLNPSPFSPVPSMTPRDGFGTEAYPSLSPSFFSPTSPHPETILKQIYPSNVTASSDRLYTITVPLEAVKFPPSFTEETPFFRCHWHGCGAWIASEGHAIMDHIKCVHKVVKGKDGAYCCEWADCLKSGEWNGLVRHIQKHLCLEWLCSMCRKSCTRRDCVRGHTKKVSGCKAAHPVSYPSKLAYKARNNGDGTVTLIKMLQPKKPI